MTRTVTVAAGVFAPGHVGELTHLVPFEVVDDVLDRVRATERRVRDLPSRVGVYFVLARCLFPQLGYVRVWGKLVAGLAGIATAAPTAKSLRDLRRRVGITAVKALFEIVAGPLAQPATPGVRWRGLRTVSFDGCVSTKVADTHANQSWLGKLNASRGSTGYPVIELMTLVETGTRGLLGAVFGPRAAETDYAASLLHLLRPGMLVLTDRGFDAAGFLTQIADTNAEFLTRLRKSRRLVVAARLDDGSCLTRLGQLTVRVIDADITVTCADGTIYGDSYRLATTLRDPRRYPATELIKLYHERWEHEVTYLAIRHTLAQHHVLRSGDPAGVTQEMWAQLTIYQLIRRAMVDALETQPGTDPDRASFTTAYQAATESVIKADNIITHHRGDILLGDIGRAVLDDLLPPRRPRTNIRKVKSPLSRYATTDPDRPKHSTKITNVKIDINGPGPPATTRRQQSLTTTAGP
jgi:hypothetical protein